MTKLFKGWLLNVVYLGRHNSSKVQNFCGIFSSSSNFTLYKKLKKIEMGKFYFKNNNDDPKHFSMLLDFSWS